MLIPEGDPPPICPYGFIFQSQAPPHILPHIFRLRGAGLKGNAALPAIPASPDADEAGYIPFPGKCGRIALFTPASVMLSGRSTTFSQAINLNVELHSLAAFLSLPFDVTSKAKDQRLRVW